MHLFGTTSYSPNIEFDWYYFEGTVIDKERQIHTHTTKTIDTFRDAFGAMSSATSTSTDQPITTQALTLEDNDQDERHDFSTNSSMSIKMHDKVIAFCYLEKRGKKKELIVSDIYDFHDNMFYSTNQVLPPSFFRVGTGFKIIARFIWVISFFLLCIFAEHTFGQAVLNLVITSPIPLFIYLFIYLNKRKLYKYVDLNRKKMIEVVMKKYHILVK